MTTHRYQRRHRHPGVPRLLPGRTDAHESTFGADYSANELSPAQLNSYTHYDIRFLIRNIGFPGNTKYISHYSGAYHRHVQARRIVLLVIENETNDPAGDHSNGVPMAD